jgi:hypothetical protein
MLDYTRLKNMQQLQQSGQTEDQQAQHPESNAPNHWVLRINSLKTLKINTALNMQQFFSSLRIEVPLKNIKKSVDEEDCMCLSFYLLS